MTSVNEISRVPRSVCLDKPGKAISKKGTKRSKSQRVFDPGKAAADFHLEMAYGWTPLVDDIYSGAEALASLSTKHSKTSVSGSHALHQRFTGGSNEKVSYDIKVKCRSDYASSYERPAMNPLIPVAQVLWERTHYSFVVDWFLPIGDLLQQLQNYQVIGGLIMKTVKSTKLAERSKPNDHDHFQFEAYGSCHRKEYVFTRRLLDQSLWGAVEMQHLKLNKSITHGLHGLALCRNISMGKKF